MLLATGRKEPGKQQKPPPQPDNYVPKNATLAVLILVMLSLAVPLTVFGVAAKYSYTAHIDRARQSLDSHHESHP